MSIKKKLGLGVASAALGLSLIGGGTYAYFSDSDTSTNTFAAGTLDIETNPEVIINVDNIKPGDWMERTFKLENKGTLDIARVLLNTAYTVTDANNNNGNNDFGSHIYVDFLVNTDGDADYEVIDSKSLAQLKNTTETDLAVEWQAEVERQRHGGHRVEWSLVDGIAAGTVDNFKVKVYFKNQGDQNVFQGDSLELKWKFTAEQTAGVHKANK